MKTYIKKVNTNILDTIGNTPLILLERLYSASNINVYGKLESQNPGGSIKDRTAYQLITHAISHGELRQGDTVIESSSGNLAIGLAQTCLYYGLRLIIVVDAKINKHTLQTLKMNWSNRVGQLFYKYKFNLHC